MTSANPDYFRTISIRAVVAELAARFTPEEAAKKHIVERSLQRIIDIPEIDLTDPLRELFPIVRQVALDQFELDVSNQINKSER